MSEWSVRVMVVVTSPLPADELVTTLSAVLSRLGHGGAAGGNAVPPAPTDTRWIGGLLHVEAQTVGRAAEDAVERMRRACAEAGIPAEEIDEVTVSCPTLGPSALRRT